MSGRPDFSEEFVETFMDGPCIVLLGDKARELVSKFDFGVVFQHDRGEELALPHRPTFGNTLLIFQARLRRSIQTDTDAQRVDSYFANRISYANSNEPPPTTTIMPIVGEPEIFISVRWAFGGTPPADGSTWQGVNGEQIERVALGLQHCFDRLYREF